MELSLLDEQSCLVRLFLILCGSELVADPVCLFVCLFVCCLFVCGDVALNGNMFVGMGEARSKLKSTSTKSLSGF